MPRFHEKSAFYRVLADPRRVALLDVFLSNGTIPVTIGDLKKFSGLTEETVKDHLDVLMTANLVEIDTKGELYRLNETDATGALKEHHNHINGKTGDAVRDSTADEDLRLTTHD